MKTDKQQNSGSQAIRIKPADEQESVKEGSHPTPKEPPEILRDEVSHGFLYTHSRANANSNKILEVASFSYALIELLNEKGLITISELDQRKNKINQRLARQFSEQGMGVAFTKDAKDKYTEKDSIDIDCESRLHLCQSACCRMRFALAVQDVEEGVVKWNLGQPYMIRQKNDGYCFHIKRAAGTCTIYEHRPFVCRAYDCREDKRIWQDFKQKIVSPDLEDFLKRPWVLERDVESGITDEIK